MLEQWRSFRPSRRGTHNETADQNSLYHAGVCSSLLPETHEARQRGGGSATKNIDAKALAGADARQGDWISHGRTYSEARYSPLNRSTPAT